MVVFFGSAIHYEAELNAEDAEEWRMNKPSNRSQVASRREQNRGLLLWSFIIGASFVAVVVVIVFALTALSTPAAQTGNAITSAAHYPQGGVRRTITFGTPGTLDTDKNHALAGIIEGSLPVGTTHVTVLSDEQCTPDSQGVSHCLNRLSYGSGEITVRHTHMMAEVPCLEPGEVLQVVAPSP